MKSFKLVLLVLFASFGMQAQESVTGKAVLTRVATGIDEIKKEDDTTKKINIWPNEDTHVQGTLAVLFRDCEKLRQSVFDSHLVTEGQLIQAVETYNNCEYTPFEP